ncbi:MAG: protocatechuate 4,5-dioxygenase subunit alpha [Woeseia sp.]|nr:protocatechuate 4,5-dioxygenase subunit alpha [Woeseia sp.]NNE60952.1 protocatechuate 4,5-dioxygenase subunit alpha [Woeseia sp.]NNL53972.1 protocatechuate 4,5-dioxygenase subunit alpha [Woeseia sp.]
MALKKPYSDIPGTIIFDSDMARAGYHANQFCMSLMKPENRERFLANERAYLNEWPMTEPQKQAILDRNYLELQKLGGNVYYFAKIFFTDKKSVAYGSSTMTGMSEKDYMQMMIDGGRSIEGNRFTKEANNG